MPDNTHSIYNMSKEEMLYQLLQKEYGYYTAILEITRIEHDKLNANLPISDIKSLLRKKKIFLDCINEIESALSPLKKYWQSKDNRSDSQSEQIKKILSDLDKVLKEILQLDLISQKTFESHLNTLREKFKRSTLPTEK
jgi:hypothetical protein